MEPILIKSTGKVQYVFFTESIQKKKDGDVIDEITSDNISKITYNEKFTVGDFLLLLVGLHNGYSRFPKMFTVIQKHSTLRNKYIGLKLNYKEYLILKDKFQVPIQLV